MIQQLPNAQCAWVEQNKIVGYLLNPQHLDGKSKEKFFTGRGFDSANWQIMRDALIAQGRNNTVTKVTKTEWGTRYQVDCHCPTPDGSNPCIRSVWEIRPEEACPRLLTAHPFKGT